MSYPKGDPGVWLASRLHPGDLVLDVGANVGGCAKHFAAAGARVMAIEPDARCHDELLSSVPSAAIHKMAAAAYVGDADLTLGTQPLHSSLRPQSVLQPAGTCTVRMTTLDSLAADVNVSAIKVDVQGCELDVLLGAPRLLFDCPLWVVEIWPHGFPRQTETVMDIYRWFEVAQKFPHTLEEPPRLLSYDDLMAWCAIAEPHSYLNLAWYGD